MHIYHAQAVLKRKTEEAEAARRKLRDLLELQARVRRDKRPGQGQGTDERGEQLNSSANLCIIRCRLCIETLPISILACTGVRPTQIKLAAWWVQSLPLSGSALSVASLQLAQPAMQAPHYYALTSPHYP
jgi:hypothetical protein